MALNLRSSNIALGIDLCLLPWRLFIVITMKWDAVALHYLTAILVTIVTAKITSRDTDIQNV